MKYEEFFVQKKFQSRLSGTCQFCQQAYRVSAIILLVLYHISLIIIHQNKLEYLYFMIMIIFYSFKCEIEFDSNFKILSSRAIKLSLISTLRYCSHGHLIIIKCILIYIL